MDWNKTIFLAHASEDKVFVKNLYNTLISSGLTPWLDEENLLLGMKWEDSIKEAIKRSRFFLACLSHNSINKNGYIQKELRMALNELESKTSNTIYFIPALIEDIEIPNITVGTINMADYQAARIYNELGIKKLIDFLKQQTQIVEEVKKEENPSFQKIREAVAEGQVEFALRMLTAYVKGRDDEFYNNITLILSRFNKLRKENVLGLINHEQYALENNRIVYSILEIIRLLEKQ